MRLMRLAAGSLRVGVASHARLFSAAVSGFASHHVAPTTIFTGSYVPRTPVTPYMASTLQPRRAYSSKKPAIELKTTCLDRIHKRHEARMVKFGHWHLPVSYADHGIAEEHHWTRKHSSLFDVSHMVQHTFQGEKAGRVLEHVMPAIVQKMPVGTSKLTALLSDKGNMLDDCVVARVDETTWYLVTNAGTRGVVLHHLREKLDPMLGQSKGVQWTVEEGKGMVAVQGPEAKKMVASCIELEDGRSWDDLYFGDIGWAIVDLGDGDKERVLISRGGYTGEDGFEIGMMDPVGAVDVVSTLLDASGVKLRLAGLGARDTLRLEAGMCLSGQDFDADTSPVMAGLSWIIPKERRVMPDDGPDAEFPPFTGQEDVLHQLAAARKGGVGIPARRVGFIVEAGPPARAGAKILTSNSHGSHTIGEVTSGGPSPTLDENIGMGYVEDGHHKVGTQIQITVRGRRRVGRLVKMPFVEHKFYRRKEQ